MARYIATLPQVDQAASAEAQMIVNEVTAPLEKWVTDAVDALQKEFSARIAESAKEITTQATGLADDLKTMSDKCNALVEEINKLHAALPNADDKALVEASKKAAADTQAYLKQREEKWRGVGTTVVKAIETAAKGLVA